MISPIKFDVLIDTTLKEEFKKVGVDVIEMEDLSFKVPLIWEGGAAKSIYCSPKTNRTVYVLERNTWLTDSYKNEVWQFDKDFTASEAVEFIKSYDKGRVKN